MKNITKSIILATAVAALAALLLKEYPKKRRCFTQIFLI